MAKKKLQSTKRLALDFQNPKNIVLVCALLFLSIVWCFQPCLDHGFNFFDDQAYISANPHVNGGLSWPNFLWAFYGFGAANWHPVTWLSYMLDVQVYGLDASGHHLTNVLLHAVNTVLVFLVFRKLTGLGWQSLAVAALFGLHPLRVEPVAWISERKDLLSTIFCLSAIWTYARFAVSRSRSFYGLTLLFFGLALMSKQMAVTLPFVFLLLDFWPLGRTRNAEREAGNWGRLILEKAPFFALSLAASVVAYVAKQQAGALREMAHLSLAGRVENVFVSYVRYLGKFFWPENLCVYYPHPGHWPMGLVVPSVLSIIGVSTFVWMNRRRIPYVFTGWFWFLGALVPVIGLVQLHSLSMADSWTYFPLLGASLALVLGLDGLARRWRLQNILPVIVVVAIASCIAVTRHQISFWKDDFVLWNHALAVTGDNEVAHNNLGILLQPAQPDVAFAHFEEAVRIKPDFADAQRNLAGQLYDRGRYDEAIDHYRKSLELDPACAWAESGLAFSLFKTGNAGESMVHLEKAAVIAPHDAGRQYVYGVALFERQKKDEAIVYLKKAVEDEPDNATYQNALGAALLQTGRVDDAIVGFQTALRLKPGFQEARANLNAALKLKEQRPAHNPEKQ